jgi:hypothetical protein
MILEERAVKKNGLLLVTLGLTACSLNHTDTLEPHQIIASPEHRWVHWQDSAPVDMTHAKVKSHYDCPSAPSD